MSALSSLPDGLGYYYGFLPGDWRRIDIRKEGDAWMAYICGNPLGIFSTKDEGEAAAVTWLKERRKAHIPEAWRYGRQPSAAPGGE